MTRIVICKPQCMETILDFKYVEAISLLSKSAIVPFFYKGPAGVLPVTFEVSTLDTLNGFLCVNRSRLFGICLRD